MPGNTHDTGTECSPITRMMRCSFGGTWIGRADRTWAYYDRDPAADIFDDAEHPDIPAFFAVLISPTDATLERGLLAAHFAAPPDLPLLGMIGTVADSLQDSLDAEAYEPGPVRNAIERASSAMDELAGILDAAGFDTRAWFPTPDSKETAP